MVIGTWNLEKSCQEVRSTGVLVSYPDPNITYRGCYTVSDNHCYVHLGLGTRLQVLLLGTGMPQTCTCMQTMIVIPSYTLCVIVWVYQCVMVWVQQCVMVWVYQCVVLWVGVVYHTITHCYTRILHYTHASTLLHTPAPSLHPPTSSHIATTM